MAANVVNLQLYKGWVSEAAPASASVKVDGSFVVAFLWEGRLQVTTRRRMDSEQVRTTAVSVQLPRNYACKPLPTLGPSLLSIASSYLGAQYRHLSVLAAEITVG